MRRTSFYFFLSFFIYEYVTETDFCQLSCGRFPHTLCDNDCQPSEACGEEYFDYDMDDTVRAELVKHINFLRNKVAKGETYLPKASHMSVVYYSVKLEKSARCWASMCLLKHDICRKVVEDEYVGQNMNIIVTTKPVRDEDIPNKMLNMIDEWFEGNTYVNKSIYEPLPPDNNLHDFYRLVSDITRLVGCGFSQWKKERSEEYYLSFICNFRPSEMIEKYIRPYELGEPGSHCEIGPSSNYPGLCKHSQTHRRH